MSVPLPDVLANCGHAGDSIARHSTACIVATDFDRGYRDGSSGFNQVKERPEGSEAYLAGWDRGYGMKLNVRYQAISWVHPASYQVDGTFRGHFDPVPFFAERLEEYMAFPLEHGQEAWDKPSSFIYDLIEQDLWTPFGGGGRVSREDCNLDGMPRLRIDGHDWGPDDTHRLHQALGIENADGEAIEPTIDPKGRPVLPPAPSTDGVLPIVDIWSASYREHFEFGAKYLVEAAAIRDQAVVNGIEPAALAAGIDRATVETIITEAQALLGLS